MCTLRCLFAFMLLSLSSCVLAACGGGGGDAGGGGGGNGGGPVLLFQESFDGSFPGSNWTVGTTGTATLDGTRGNPAPPCLCTDDASAQTNPTFDSSSGLTIYVFFAVEQATLDQIIDGCSVTIMNVNTGKPIAQVSRTSPDRIRYTATSSQGAPQWHDEVFAAGDDFHDFWFRVDAAGKVEWYRGGFLKFAPTLPVAHGNYAIVVGGRAAVAYYDQIEVLRP